MHRVLASVAGAAVLAGLMSGCGVTIPSDPGDTLATVRGGELRIGISPDPPLVVVTDGEPSGSVVDLVEEFAVSLDATPEWTVATEESLVGMLEDGELDLIAGGITSDTPWMERAGVSRAYANIPDARGHELVMLVPLGENAFLSALERFLDGQVGS